MRENPKFTRTCRFSRYFCENINKRLVAANIFTHIHVYILFPNTLALFCPCCHGLVDLCSLFCPSRPAQADLTRLIYSRVCPVPDVLNRMFCHGCPTSVDSPWFSCRSCPVLAILIWHPSHSHLSCLYYPNCLPRLSFLRVLSRLSYLASCPGCPVSRLFCPRCPLLVLYRLLCLLPCPSCPGLSLHG